MMKAPPRKIRTAGNQTKPRPATLLRFSTATTAAAIRNIIPIRRSTLGDKIGTSFFQKPKNSLVLSQFLEAVNAQVSIRA
jgi:hypothetical protein